MNYAAGTTVKENFYKPNRPLARTDGVFPTATMRLHQRIVGWHRKRRIPVYDADKSNTLNAYLIDPKYLENGEVITPPKEIPDVQAKPNIPVYQYSKITHDSARRKSNLIVQIAEAGRTLRKYFAAGVSAFVADIAARYHSFTSPTHSSIYTINSGLSPWWKQRLKVFTAALLSGGLIVAAAAIDGSVTNNPLPVSANPKPTTAQSVTSSQPQKNTIITPPTGSANQTSGTRSQSSSTQQNAPSAAPVVNAQPNSTATVPTGPASATTSPTTTSSSQTPSSSTQQSSSSVLDPVLTPITNTVNSIPSTQITVTSPL